MASRLERVELGIDDKGEPITSCIVVDEGAARAATKPAKKATGWAQVALDQLRELSLSGEAAPDSNHIPSKARVVSLELWRKYFDKKHPSSNPDNKRRTFDRAVARLQELDFIGIWDDLAWLPQVPDKSGQTRTSGKFVREA